MGYYDYNDIKIDGKTRISPSSLPRLYDSPSKWYKENILKEKSFFGNSATVFGTIVHARINRYYDGLEPTDLDSEFEYIETYKDNPDVDEWKIADDLERMWDLIRLDYLEKYPKPDSMEEAIVFEPPECNYFLGGSFDALEKNTVIDFKTTSRTPSKITVEHRLQLLMYALILNLQGRKVDKMRVVYIVKLKKEPKIVVLEEKITDDDMNFIKSEVKNIITRLEKVEEDSSMRDLLFAINPTSRYS